MKSRLFVLHALALAALVTLTASPVSASVIGVFFDQEATDCEASVTAPNFVTWYVCAVLFEDPLASIGIAAAEFRQTGTPIGWIMTVTPSPASNVSIGDPLGAGCDIAFPTCQGVSPPHVVLLYTVTGVATSQVTDAELHIEMRSPPTNPNFQCPVLVICLPPTFGLYCVGGSDAVINRSGSKVCPPVAIATPSWSGMKALYRD
jgi:hypothetical protein